MKDEFNPKTFFALNDLDSNGLLDMEEVTGHQRRVYFLTFCSFSRLDDFYIKNWKTPMIKGASQTREKKGEESTCDETFYSFFSGRKWKGCENTSTMKLTATKT